MTTYITSWTELAAMSNNLAEDYILSNSLSKTDTDYPGGWTPIGNNTTKFTGTFDGQDYTIDGLAFNTSDYYQGLFGFSDGATISNINIIAGYSKGVDYVGGLVGRADSTVMTGCHVTAQYLRGDDYVGGIVGYAINSSLSDCTFEGFITGDYIGGLVGRASTTSIINSYALAVIDGDSNVGGLVGYQSTTSSIEKSYFRGTIFARTNAGGLVGYAATSCSCLDSYAIATILITGATVGGLIGYQSGGTITNCYALPICVGASNVGGLVGLSSEVTTTSSYWDTETSNMSSSAEGTGKTTAQMKAELTFTSWDFIGGWSIDEGNDYPKIIGITNAITIYTMPQVTGPDYTAETFGYKYAAQSAFELDSITPPIYNDVDFVLTSTAPPASFTNPYVKISGTMVLKPIYFKISGVFVEKIIKVKASGSFQ